MHVETIAQAEALFTPQRVEVLRSLDEPRSCTEIGVVLGQTPQKVYYHVKKLLSAELALQVDERRVRGIHEGVYQAAARSYWLSPRLLGTIGKRPVRDELSLGYLLQLVEDVQVDLSLLDGGQPDDEESAAQLATLGVSGEIRLRAQDRPAFLADLRQTLQGLFARHGGSGGEVLRLAVACYPRPDAGPDTKETRS